MWRQWNGERKRSGQKPAHPQRPASAGCVSWLDILLRRLFQRLVYGFNEHVGCPWTCGRTPAAVVVHGRLRRLDLLERSALLLQVADSIADNVNHVPVVGNVADITDPAAARKNDCSSLRPEFSISQIED